MLILIIVCFQMAPSNKRPRKKPRTKSNKSSVPSSTSTSSSSPTTSDSQPSKQSEALTYLTQWKSNRSEWKFKKLTQSYILSSILDLDVLSKSYFQLACEYLADLKGQARLRLVETCEAVLMEKKNRENAPESEVKQPEESGKSTEVEKKEENEEDDEKKAREEKRLKTKYKRAKVLLKQLRDAETKA